MAENSRSELPADPRCGACQGVEKKLKPLVVTVLDAGAAASKSPRRKDGTSLRAARSRTARRTARWRWGMGSRALFQRAQGTGLLHRRGEHGWRRAGWSGAGRRVDPGWRRSASARPASAATRRIMTKSARSRASRPLDEGERGVSCSCKRHP